jgi:Family of unknown function (DUF6361)
MASTLAWLDFSESEQKQAREIVQLFIQRESRDELGIGVVRDVFSNAMFPGVSVIHTRARYFCIIPWIFQKAGEKGRTGRDLLNWQNKKERALVEILRNGGDEEGLIGRQAGISVKTLPSVIYWNALQRYGILLRTASIEQVANAQKARFLEDGIMDQIDRSSTLWDPNMPAAPKGFPDLDSMNFVLTEDESTWLRERLLATTEGSLLAWMIQHKTVPSLGTVGPWEEPWCGDLPEDVARIVHHSEVFSLVMNGAAILYNALLAERCVELGIGDWEAEALDYRTRFTDWLGSIDRESAKAAAWNLPEFWSIVDSEYSGHIPLAKRFISEWVAWVRSEERLQSRADLLIAQRERQQKKNQARLSNELLLRQWGGSSGAERLNFRWTQVRRMMLDLVPEEV